MMILRAVEPIEAPAPRALAPNGGDVPVLGQAATITRAWFQCDGCGLVGCIDGLASPMVPPPCAGGCDTAPEDLV